MTTNHIPKWKRQLTEKEIAHLAESGAETLSAFKRNAEYHAKCRARNEYKPALEPCWICRGIAVKLDIPV